MWATLCYFILCPQKIFATLWHPCDGGSPLWALPCVQHWRPSFCEQERCRLRNRNLCFSSCNVNPGWGFSQEQVKPLRVTSQKYLSPVSNHHHHPCWRQIPKQTHPKVPCHRRHENAIECTVGVGTLAHIEDLLNACQAPFVVSSTIKLELCVGWWWLQVRSCAGVFEQIRNIYHSLITSVVTWINVKAPWCSL